MSTRTAQVDDLRLVAAPSAVNCMEMFVRFTLAEWQLKPLLDEAMATARSLIAAACRSVGSTGSAILSVRLRLRDDHLAIEVEGDELGRVPVPESEMPRRHTDIVTLDHGGKLMWCELPLPTGVSAGEVSLPRRAQKSTAAGPPTADADPQVMQRVLTGLNRHEPRHGI
ncbi:hypothetical protein EV191_101575 [Tamaricihabitans halophyticus]|uniref:Histidine kinase-like protein n=1 Tax=Tamaricihabitans halophyticus TaxID=1262583 RepID=A0A4R2R1Q2_9PSEU|nr:ATP-binding protein [Tamaricihabitans halophyticus]TCP56630.1 hypothetical protein EV191_101575 [Tamaricihabitans halophyticus]